MLKVIFFILALCSTNPIAAEQSLSILGGLGLFQQQVKSKVGDDRATPIVDEAEFNLNARYTFRSNLFRWGGYLRIQVFTGG